METPGDVAEVEKTRTALKVNFGRSGKAGRGEEK